MKSWIRFTIVTAGAVALATAGGLDTPLQMADKAAKLYLNAQYGPAEELYRRALAEWPSQPSAMHGRGIIEGNLGELLRTTGRYKEAMPVLLDGLKHLESAGPAAAADMGRVLDDLAVLYRTTGRLSEAEQSADRAAALVHPVERPANELVRASIYIVEERFTLAEPLLKEVAAGDDDRAALTAHLSLAVAALAQDHFSESEAHARHALEMAERALPKNHPAIATALNDLAAACRFQGQFLEAEKRYREAIAMWEETVGPEHPDLAKGLLGLAGLYHEREREVGAESLYERAIHILEHSLGKNDPQVLTARVELADVLRAERRYTESEKLSRETVPAMEKAFGPHDPRVRHGLSNYARLLTETNRKAEAAAVRKRIELMETEPD